jgi:hypothetical protein
MAKMDTLPAREIKGQVIAYFTRKGWSALDEITLPNKRRLDVCAVGPGGGLIGVETKVSEADLRQDEKWVDYLQFVDTFYFCIPEHLPAKFVHENVGLLVQAKGKVTLKRLCPRSLLSEQRRVEMISFLAGVAVARYTATKEFRDYHNCDGKEGGGGGPNAAPQGIGPTQAGECQ